MYIEKKSDIDPLPENNEEQEDCIKCNLNIVMFDMQKSRENLNILLERHYNKIDVVLVQEPF